MILQLLEFGNDLFGLGTVAEALSASGVADDSPFVDDERGRSIAPFRMNAHLEGHAVCRADRQSGIHEQGILQIVRAEAGFSQEIFCREDFMRIDGQELSLEFLQRFELFAQLRELPVTDRSGISVNEYKHHSFLAAKAAQANLASAG